MIDINELRRKLRSGDIVDHIDIHANAKPILTELLDRFEAAEKERDALRAKITEMEQQEPVGWLRLYADGSSSEDFTDTPHVFERQRPLYARPVPAQSVPEGWKEAAIAWEVCASIHREWARGKDAFFNTRQADFVNHADKARAMIAAALKPEAKP